MHHRFRRHTLALVAIVFILLAGLTSSTSPISAAVPGKAFTETGCDGLSDSVARLYTAGLGREPDVGGFDFWMTEYTEGRRTLRSMAAFFVASPEFAATYGALDDAGFVRQVYRNVLGREGEQTGVDFWVDQMASGATRSTILMRFSESPENITNSGTTQPILGAFNEGLGGPWSCPDWFVTQPASSRDGCRLLPGQTNDGSQLVRLTITNPRSEPARGTAWHIGSIDGAPQPARGSQTQAVRPGETVDFIGVLPIRTADVASVFSVTCRIDSIRWTDEAITPVANGCVLGGVTSTGLRRFSTTVTNPLSEPAMALVNILPRLDGRRINTQLQAVLNVAPGQTATSSGVITSDRLRDVPQDRISCEGINVLWIKD